MNGLWWPKLFTWHLICNPARKDTNTNTICRHTCVKVYFSKYGFFSNLFLILYWHVHNNITGQIVHACNMVSFRFNVYAIRAATLKSVHLVNIWLWPDNFKIEIKNVVNVPYLDENVPRPPSNGINILQLIRFAWVCYYVSYSNKRQPFLTAELLKQGFDIINFVKHFLNSTTGTQSWSLNTMLTWKTSATRHTKASIL